MKKELFIVGVLAITPSLLLSYSEVQSEKTFANGQALFCLAFHPKQEIIAYSSSKPEVFFRNYKKESGLSSINLAVPGFGPQEINAFAISVRNKLGVGKAGGKFLILDLGTQKTEFFETGDVLINRVLFSADGKLFLTAGHHRKKAKVGLVEAWDVELSKRIWWIETDSEVASLMLSPKGENFAFGQWNGRVQVFSQKDFKEEAILNSDELTHIFSISFSPDGKLLGTGCGTGEVRIWKLEDGSLWRKLKVGSHPVTNVAFFNDGKTVASTDLNWVRIWEVESGKQLGHFEAHPKGKMIMGMNISPDGNYLATVSLDGTLKLWNTAILMRFKDRQFLDSPKAGPPTPRPGRLLWTQ